MTSKNTGKIILVKLELLKVFFKVNIREGMGLDRDNRMYDNITILRLLGTLKVSASPNGTKYSRMDQVKFVEDSL